MKQTKYVITLAAAIVMAFGLVSCKNAPEEPTAVADTLVTAVENEAAAEEEVPFISWKTAIDEYLVNEIGPRMKLGNGILIPCYSIIAVDSSDANAYRVWGDWWVYAYDGYGNKLITSMAVGASGLFSLKRTASGFEVIRLDEVEEGRGIEESVQRIFGEYSDVFWTVSDDQEGREKQRLAMVTEYVHRNNLPYTELELDSSEPAVKL